jgi:hypothetical protein
VTVERADASVAQLVPLLVGLSDHRREIGLGQ